MMLLSASFLLFQSRQVSQASIGTAPQVSAVRWSDQLVCARGSEALPTAKGSDPQNLVLRRVCLHFGPQLFKLFRREAIPNAAADVFVTLPHHSRI